MTPDIPKDSYRCVVYCRKSVVGRLDQEYDSIASQFDVCSAYIKSQVHKGWRQLCTRYDDFGQSGASLDRPALRLLLSDIERGAVDVVVVYKIDRLTRSLRDFVRLLEIFERYGVGVVSITQAFDTNDTLGRLLLNILLTFAQFEREMLSDRMRDKKRAMKKRGMWTGGQAPYGYDLVDGKLVQNDREAAVVQLVFQQFLVLRCYSAVAKKLQSRGFKNKYRVTKAGRVWWEKPITCGTINYMIGNAVYVLGVLDESAPDSAKLSPIIDRETWEMAQEIRRERSRYKIHRGTSPNVLLGILYDSLGRPMTISHFLTKGKEYRYYISNDAGWAKRTRQRRFRSNALELEELIRVALIDVLCDRERMRSMLLRCGVHGLELEALGAKGKDAAALLRSGSPERLGLATKALIGRIELSRETVSIVLRCRQFERLLRWRGSARFRQDRKYGETQEATELLSIAANMVRCERSLFFPRHDDDRSAKPNQRLVKLIGQAREAKRLLEEDGLSMEAIAAGIGRKTISGVARIVRLNYLAPDIIMSILHGSQPPELTRTQLIRANLPLDWSLQRRLFGFPERAPMQMGEVRY